MIFRTTPAGCRHILPCLCALAGALLLGAFASAPITPETISGKYEIEGKPQGMWFSGESIVLGNGTFEYSLYTADVVDSRTTRAPIRGRYKLDGKTITFLNSAVPYPERTLTHRNKKMFILWTPKQVSDFHDTGIRPGDLLYQQR